MTLARNKLSDHANLDRTGRQRKNFSEAAMMLSRSVAIRINAACDVMHTLCREPDMVL